MYRFFEIFKLGRINLLRIKSAQKKICLNTPSVLTTLNFIPNNALNEQYTNQYGLVIIQTNNLAIIRPLFVGSKDNVL